MNTNRPIVIAVDTGNWNVKTSSPAVAPFATGVTSHGSVPPPLTNGSLCFENKYYSVCMRRVETRRDKTMNDEYFVLVLAAIARELQGLYPNRREYKECVALALGLPVQHLSLKIDGILLKDRYKEFFSRGGNPIYFEYEGTPFCISITNVGVFAQTFSALIAYPDVYEQVCKQSRTYLIDIGGGTTNVICVVAGRPENPGYTFEDCGILTLYKQIRRRVMEECAISVDDFIIDAILRGEKTADNSLNAVIKQVVKDFAEDVVLRMKSHGIDLDMSFLVFIGGGSVLLHNQFIETLKRDDTLIIPDVKGNAIGYEMQELAVLKNKFGIHGISTRDNLYTQEI